MYALEHASVYFMCVIILAVGSVQRRHKQQVKFCSLAACMVPYRAFISEVLK